MLPKISIVTPSFNQGQFIEETILSVLDQCYPNLEYIIIDGGSTDESVDIIKHYSKKLQYWVSESDNGQAHAINKGFSRASGQIFMWLNSDDLLLKESLNEIAIQYIKSSVPKKFIGLGRRIYINNESVVTKHLSYSFGMSNHQAIAWGVSRGPHQEATCWSKEIWKKYGPLNDELNYAFDLEFFLKILSLNIKPIFIPKFKGAWRQWESNKCTIGSSAMNKEVLIIKSHARYSNSIFVNKYLKKIARKITKISQTKWNYISGLPKIGNHISSNQTVKKPFIQILWKILFSKLI